MAFDAQSTFANLAEKERLCGHHSAEGRAIRMLSRALNGWSVGGLAPRDALVLCDQALADWLKARLQLSQWSAQSSLDLVPAAAAKNLLTITEAERLKAFAQARHALEPTTADVESALAGCIEIVENYWS
ncbi:MAG: hypothetical protein EXR70_09940 [Deltaproteobacteria bacterium]|nr:hypothetical protein [Deltaproteobacteria bacterium]